MNHFLKRSAALLVLLLSLAWLCRAPDWEPLIAFVVALLGYGVLEWWQTFRSLSSHDIALIGAFRALFPPASEAVDFLRDHDIAIPYHHRKTRPLLRFYDEWVGVDYEFDDRDLEEAKARFSSQVAEYVKILIVETYAHGSNPDLNTMDFDDWDNPPEKVAARDKLNKLGTDVLNEYEAFVRIVRKITKETEQGGGGNSAALRASP